MSAAAPRVGLVTCSARPPGWEDERPVAARLAERGIEVDFPVWDGSADWRSYDLLVVRSTWDYSHRRDEFVAWARSVGPERLRNRPEVLEWNTDKRYLAELDGAGFPVPPTLLVAPDGPVPELGSEVVVKPVIGAGARDTGRFGVAAMDGAYELIARLGREGRVAMVQPYLEEIERFGETAVVMIAGEFSHALSKRAFLEPDEVAPVVGGEAGEAVAMGAEDLIRAAEPSRAELELASGTLGWLAQRFGRAPLYARVDMVTGPGGRPVLMEVELTEPSLYLAEAGEEAASRFAEAIEAEVRWAGA